MPTLPQMRTIRWETWHGGTAPFRNHAPHARSPSTNTTPLSVQGSTRRPAPPGAQAAATSGRSRSPWRRGAVRPCRSPARAAGRPSSSQPPPLRAARRGRALARRAMEAARRGPRAGAGSSALLLALLLHGAMGAEAEEPRPPRQRGDEQCHYYAGGQVYPGEAARVPVTDHSLHLSQAKSRCGADGRRGDAPGAGCGAGGGWGRGLGRGQRWRGHVRTSTRRGAGRDWRGNLLCSRLR